MTTGTNHFGNGKMELTVEQAKEQLQYELRNQLGQLTFEVKRYDEQKQSRGDGLVVAKINGRQVDHYIFHEQSDMSEGNSGSER